MPSLLDAARQCLPGDVEQIRAVLSAGAKIDEQGEDDKTTALMISAKYGNMEAVELLLQKGARMDLLDEYGESALVQACGEMAPENDEEIVRLLLEKATSDDVSQALIKTCLKSFAKHESAEAIATLLLDKGAILDLVGTAELTEGYTALTAAIEGENAAFALELIKRGAPTLKVEKVTDGGEIVKSESPMHVACKFGLRSVVSELLDAEIGVNDKNEDGETPLHVAVAEGQLELVELLIDKKANVNSRRDADRLTPLMVAAELEMDVAAEIIETLVEEGEAILGKRDQKSEGGRTALFIACEMNSYLAAFTLLRLGASAEDKATISGKEESVMGMLAVGKMSEQIKVLVEMENEDLSNFAASAFLGASDSPSVLNLLLRLADAAQRMGIRVRARDTSLADDYNMLSVNLQLACGGLIAELGADDDDDDDDGRVMTLMRSEGGKAALEFAVTASLKGFISQPLVQATVRRQWRGAWLQDLLCPQADEIETWRDKARYALSWVAFLFVLPLQTVLLVPLSAIVPPAAEPLKMAMARGRVKLGWDFYYESAYAEVHRYFLFDDSPQIKYMVAFVFDAIIVLLLTVLGSGWFGEAEQHVSALLFFCAMSTWLSELRALIEDGLRAYLADFFNFADIIFNLVTAIAVIYRIVDVANADALPGEAVISQTSRTLLAFSALGMWLRLANVLQLSATTGPFVLMVFKMVRDVTIWLVLYAVVLLGFAAGLIALFSGPPPSGFVYAPADDCIAPDEELSTFWSALLLLWEGGLTGEAYFECVRQSSSPIAAPILMYLFQIFVGLLMVNMLIAMMAKTFDNVAEAQEVNYMFLFAQTAAEWRKQPRAPPSIGLLSMPWQLSMLLIGLCPCTQSIKERLMVEDPDKTFELDSEWKASQTLKELGENVTEFVSGHADDVPAEDRWRTLFARKLTVHFEELRRQGEETEEKLEERMEALERSMNAIVRKLGVKVANVRPRRNTSGKSSRVGGRQATPSTAGLEPAVSMTRGGMAVVEVGEKERKDSVLVSDSV
jgi:ankyrin repeat protein